MFEVGTSVQPWDGRDSAGRIAPAGLYFVELRAGDTFDRARLVRMR